MSIPISQSQKIIVFLLIVGIFLPLAGFCQEPLKVPGTVEEAQNAAKSGAKTIMEKTPTIIKTIWQEQVMPIWRKMWNLFKDFWVSFIKDFFRNLWYSTLKPQIKSIIEKVQGILGKEIEKQTPLIEENFQKEKKQMSEELPQVTESFWQRFKGLLK